jgi:hypothetical protein
MKRPKPTSDSGLLASLKVLSSILKDEGSLLETHVLLRNGMAIVNNGMIAIGEPIKEDLNACPNGLMLKNALSKCGQSMSITQLETRLSIKSDKFRALVPCIPSEDYQPSFPDPPVAQLDDRLKVSLSAVAPLALDENSVVTASVLIHAGTVTATDRKVIIQHWHGIDLPPMLALPKALIGPLIKNTKKLTGFGFSNSSCTFHFEDKSWLKSQYFAEKWPDINHILNKQVNAWPLPSGFYDGVKALEPFSENGFIYCDTNLMRSHEEGEIGATYEVYGLPKGSALNIKQLKMIEPFIKTVDFLVPHNGHKMMLFYGDSIRGAIAGRV